MDKPTDAQIREFWEWCEIKQDSDKSWRDTNGIGVLVSSTQPNIDLNNLFKYAVPKLIISDSQHLELHYLGSHTEVYILPHYYHLMGQSASSTNKDPALALFWAIWEVIHKESQNVGYSASSIETV